ncbi:hypothetical protein QYM36_005275 [Artemia franciscana]|uniref:RNA-directed DNA polymerase n=1 Tax=Artemia franciscana TaxID=6661 RepID=A0AA88LB42_ARTSF|nr:hypothetical protein QYM36_005275 [Artemia franciscana]
MVVRTDVTIDPGTFKNVDCKLIYGDEIKIEDGDNLIVTPLEGYENYLHDYVSTVYDQKTKILIFNDSCIPIEFKHYTEIASFSRFPKESLVAFSKSLECNGSMIEEKEVEWDSKEYLSQFDFSSVPNVVQLELEALLLNSKSCFSRHPYDVGKNDLMIFKPDIPIDTEFKPPKQFRIPYQMALVLEEHIQAMLQSGIIKEESSQFPSPVFLIRKHSANKNEQLSKENTRFLIDLRTCNTKMKDTAFLIPRTTDILQNLSKGKFYSEFDMRSGFFQISIDENYQKFFSFLSPLTGRSHCYTRIPQGSVFGPKAFASFMDKLFPAEFRSFVFNFFDDIYLKTESPNPKDHLEHLKRLNQNVRTELNIQVVLPKRMIPGILKLFHEHLALGIHASFERTLWKVRKFCIFENMASTIKEFVNNCDLCNRANTKKIKPPLGKNIVPEMPFLVWALDGAGPFPITSSGNRYVLVGVDLFSSLVVLKCIPAMNAENTIKFLWENIIAYYGLPEAVLTDHGSNFDNIEIKKMFSEINCKKIYSSPYNPQCNGASENKVKILKKILSHSCGKLTQVDWDEKIPLIMLSMNSSLNTVRKFSSFTIVHGFSGKSLADLQFNKPTNLNYFDGYDSYVTRLIQNICEIHQTCLNEIKIQRSKQAIQYNKDSKETLIASGDIVYCRDTTSVGRKSTNYSFRGP